LVLNSDRVKIPNFLLVNQSSPKFLPDVGNIVVDHNVFRFSIS